MNAIPCTTDFPNPADLHNPWDHCTGVFNVTVSGVEWIVDFECQMPIVMLGDVEVTDHLKPALQEKIIKLAIEQHDAEKESWYDFP